MKRNIKNFILSVLALFTVSFSFFGCGNDLAEENLVEPSDWSEGVMVTNAYIMASIGTAKTMYSDALHLAYSEDGLTWTSLNGNAAIYMPTPGSGHIRDPFIFRMNDGKFVLLATDFTEAGQLTDMGSHYKYNYWEHPSRYIYVAFSKDLINWYGEHLLKVTDGKGKNGGTRHAWSPRVVYNKMDRCYDIYWVGDDENGINRTYVTQTTDFMTVKSLKDRVIFSPGYSVADSFVIKAAEDKYYMMFIDDKNDLETGAGLDLQVAELNSCWGDACFSNVFERYYYINRFDYQENRIGVEMPCAYLLPDGITWLVIASKSQNLGSYKAYASINLEDKESWLDYTDKMSFDFSTEACTVTRVTTAELESLKAAF